MIKCLIKSLIFGKKKKNLIKVGEIYTKIIKKDENPFLNNHSMDCQILDVKDKWVKFVYYYRHDYNVNNNKIDSCKIKEFLKSYRIFDPDE